MTARFAFPALLSATMMLAALVTPGVGKETAMLLDAVSAGDLAKVQKILPEADLEAHDAQGRTALLLPPHPSALTAITPTPMNRAPMREDKANATVRTA